jgi:hypothetical protein
MMLVACGTPVATSSPCPSQQSNFAIRFEYGSCDANVLDTFNGTYTRDMIIEPKITIALQLSDSQVVAIYQKMIEIRFFDYPGIFSIPTPKNGLVRIVMPATQDCITVRNGELNKSLFWLDEIVDPKCLRQTNCESFFNLLSK